MLDKQPIFTPIVGDFYQGMLVFIPLHLDLLPKETTVERIRNDLEEYYSGERFIKVASQEEVKSIKDGFLSPTACNDTNMLEIFAFARDGQVLLVSRLDNLGKGASGSAVQNMNLMIGVPEDKGL